MVETFRIGIMKTSLHDELSPRFQEQVDAATEQIRQQLTDDLQLAVEIFTFTGPQLSSTHADYSPLDFLQLGLAEKAGRNIHFLLVIFEEDLSASNHTYRLALPSKLTNIGLLSTKRLSPSFWGNEPDPTRTTQRLARLMLHTLGHILGLDHHDDSHNIMYGFRATQDFDEMQTLTDEQIAAMREMIPLEAHEEVTRRNRLVFMLKHLVGNTRIIWETVREAHPLRLLSNLSTVITAAFSVIVVLFFTAEIWDVAGAFQLPPLLVFSLVALVSSTGVFYSVFKWGPNHGQKRLSESQVVVISATLVTLLLVNLLLYVLFFSLSLFSALLMFPDTLKVTWTTASPADTLLAQMKLSIFLATMGVLTGSLGGRADSAAIIHSVLFFDEET